MWSNLKTRRTNNKNETKSPNKQQQQNIKLYLTKKKQEIEARAAAFDFDPCSKQQPDKIRTPGQTTSKDVHSASSDNTAGCRLNTKPNLQSQPGDYRDERTSTIGYNQTV